MSLYYTDTKNIMSHCWFLTLNKTFFRDEKKVCCVFFHHREETCIWARFNLTPIPYSFRTQCDNECSGSMCNDNIDLIGKIMKILVSLYHCFTKFSVKIQQISSHLLISNIEKEYVN